MTPREAEARIAALRGIAVALLSIVARQQDDKKLFIHAIFKAIEDGQLTVDKNASDYAEIIKALRLEFHSLEMEVLSDINNPKIRVNRIAKDTDSNVTTVDFR